MLCVSAASDTWHLSGSGPASSVTLVWLGRRRIPGIEPGRTVTARGRFADVEGKRVIYNPWYELGAG